jgi:hypothetical protein
VIPQDAHQPRRNRDNAHVFDAPVFQAPPIVHLPGVSPPLPRRRSRLTKRQFAPTGVRELAVRLPQRQDLSRPGRRVVHGRKEAMKMRTPVPVRPDNVSQAVFRSVGNRARILWGSETRCGVLSCVPGVLPGDG